MPSAVALVPARSGSQRVPGKNVLPLAGHPLIAYSIAGAQTRASSRRSSSRPIQEIAEIGRRYGAGCPAAPTEMGTATSFDIEWVVHVMKDRDEEIFAILRPTSPFRTGDTIRRAYARLVELGDRADSIRAVEPARQHPGKMWTLEGDLIEPLLPQPEGETPLHSRQYQALPKVYAQNSSLELAWSRVLADPVPTISGHRVAPFFTEGAEGFPDRLPGRRRARRAPVARGEAELPPIREAVRWAVGRRPARAPAAPRDPEHAPRQRQRPAPARGADGWEARQRDPRDGPRSRADPEAGGAGRGAATAAGAVDCRRMGRRGGRAGVRDPALGRRPPARPGRPAARPDPPGAPVGRHAADAFRRSSECHGPTSSRRCCPRRCPCARGPTWKVLGHPDAGDGFVGGLRAGKGRLAATAPGTVPAAAVAPAPGFRPRARERKRNRTARTRRHRPPTSTPGSTTGPPPHPAG